MWIIHYGFRYRHEKNPYLLSIGRCKIIYCWWQSCISIDDVLGIIKTRYQQLKSLEKAFSTAFLHHQIILKIEIFGDSLP